MIRIPFLNKEFQSKTEVVTYLKQNKQQLVNLKKAKEHHTDAAKFQYTFLAEGKPVDVSKADAGTNPVPDNVDTIQVKVVMNSTNWLDSHLDVHIPGIWKKTLEQNANKGFYLLQEHNASFDKVISHQSDVKVYTEFKNWTELGVNASGQSECLIFEATIKKSVNPFMFEQYKNQYVKNHSVGMMYVHIGLAIYDENDEKEMEYWNKYRPQVINGERADELGFFWVVTEAKLREGSAVLFGSNEITPTLETTETKEEQPSNHEKPSDDISSDPPQEKKRSQNLLLI